MGDVVGEPDVPVEGGPAVRRAPSNEGYFGGTAFRDRFTDAVWQGPTWSFAILLFVLVLGETPRGPATVALVLGFSVIMLVTALALLVRWEWRRPWTQLVLPLGDLVGAALMVLAVPAGTAPTTLLLCSLPAVWLAFEFGRAGTAIAVAAVGALGVASCVVGDAATGAPLGAATLVVPVLFVIGLAVVARLMSGVLSRVGDTLRSRTADLAVALDLAEARLVVTTGVMTSIDAGVIVLRPGAAPLYNDRAAALAVRAGTSADTPDVPGDKVFLDDGTTPVPDADQAVVRAHAGDDFAGIVQWVGEPGDQAAVVFCARELLRPNGERLGSVLAAWDATELMNAIRVREEFVTTVSHELRTPLTAISVSLELLDELITEEGRDADRDALLSASIRNSALLEARIAELMASSATVHAISASSTDVSELVGFSLDKHAAAAEAAGLTLRTQIEADVVAEVDPTRFEQVVDNLVSNAIKYTPSGSVTVALRVEGRGLVLTVADSGVGMTRDEQRQAFDRFYRSPQARAAAVQGLGIGLALVRTIVERHRGWIDLVSSPDAGTTVTVSVPLVHPADPTPVRGAGEVLAGGAPPSTAQRVASDVAARRFAPAISTGRLTHVLVEAADALVDDVDLVDFLHTLTTHAADVGEAEVAGLLVGERPDDLRPLAVSDESGEVLRLLRLPEGPAAECLRTGERVPAVDLASAGDRWPHLATSGAEAGFHSARAFPLRVRGRTVGALTLLSRHEQPAAEDDRAVQALADLASIALRQQRDQVWAGRPEARTSGAAGSVLEQLQDALDCREVVEQAKGVLAQQMTTTQAAAFELLRSEARRSRRRVVDVATEVVQGAGQAEPSPGVAVHDG